MSLVAVNQENPSDRYLTPSEAAIHLRVSKSYLDKLRVYGGGPQFLRLGKRKILYAAVDLDAWAASRRHNSTSEYGV
jgi:predicted DNA-binding transcriptional regulator AlpA